MYGKRGESDQADLRWQTALRGSLEGFDLVHPAGQWVPSRTNLGHHLQVVDSKRLKSPTHTSDRTGAISQDEAKRVLALSDLEHAKTAVLNSLTSASGQRTYDHAISEFVSWYCLIASS